MRSLEQLERLIIPSNIFIRSSQLYTNPDFFPGFFDVEEHSTQSLMYIKEYQEGNSKDGGAILFVRCVFGVRVAHQESLSEIDLVEADDRCAQEAGLIPFQIDAVLESMYVIDGDVSDEEIDHYVRDKSLSLSWPYWREYVGDVINRMGLDGPNIIPFLPK